MVLSVSSLVNVYKFPLGRIAFALTAVARRAQDADVSEIAAFARGGAERVQQVINMTTERPADATLYPPAAAALDNQLDHCIGGLDSYLESQARMYLGEARAQSAEHLREVCFPDRVAGITQLTYAEQHATIDAMLDRVAGAKHAEHVAALPEFAGLIGRVRELNARYGAALQPVADAPTRVTIRAAKAECQDLLATAVAAIIGHFGVHAPDRLADRDRLLEPILAQNEAIRLARRRRRRVTDIDPETGEEVLDPAVDPAPETLH